MLVTRRGFIQTSSTGLALIGGGLIDPLEAHIVSPSKDILRYQKYGIMINEAVKFLNGLKTDKTDYSKEKIEFNKKFENILDFGLNEFDSTTENKEKEITKQLELLWSEKEFLDTSKIGSKEYVDKYINSSEKLYDPSFVILGVRSFLKGRGLKLYSKEVPSLPIFQAKYAEIINSMFKEPEGS